MIHRCSCGHELAPADAAESVDAITTGICARCAAKYMHARHPFWYPVCIEGYQVQFLIQPGRGSPHVAMDSPRYWDPPRPMQVIGTRLYLDGVELDPAEFKDLCAEARRRANVPGGTTGRSRSASFSRQLQLGLSGHLQRAMERTGYAE
ncbi:MAG TPA: hypothetical protein VJ553_05310 [Candidatus Paceibacterota bacterium]|nr:hypothetical protein [Candidatus Paceibacterota bacterium]